MPLLFPNGGKKKYIKFRPITSSTSSPGEQPALATVISGTPNAGAGGKGQMENLPNVPVHSIHPMNAGFRILSANTDASGILPRLAERKRDAVSKFRNRER